MCKYRELQETNGLESGQLTLSHQHLALNPVQTAVVHEPTIIEHEYFCWI